jgi:AGCS family alanine or glycine:cation symporter
MVIDFLNSLISVFEWVMLLFVIGGGVFLFVYSQAKPLRFINKAFNLLKKDKDVSLDSSQISNFQALTAVIASTVGLGNISGVAIAIYMGGPGVVFWMWITALIGMVIKFYSCSLAVKFRETNGKGEILAGPMYYMKQIKGFGKPLGIFYATVTLFGVLPAFTSNQMTNAIVEITQPAQYVTWDIFYIKFFIGVVFLIMTAYVIFGGLQKIVHLTAKLVPLMVGLYLLIALFVIFTNFGGAHAAMKLIFVEAFNFNTAVSGGLMGLIIIGMRRAVFSNESGLGTAPMYHGQSKANRPVDEGIVAMLGPFIDTIVVCSITALVILISGTYIDGEKNGILLTMQAFDLLLFDFGKPLLLVMVLVFGVSTLFTYSYYGTKCIAFLLGDKYKNLYHYPYLISIILAAVASLDLVIAVIDLSFALMSIANMIAVIYLSKYINQELKNKNHV